MAYQYSARVPLLDSSSSSSYTSNALLTVDYRQLTISVVTTDTGASRFTVQGSNDDGLRSAIAFWSGVTTITLQGIYTIDPGARWLRCLRSALDSLSTVVIQGRS